MSRFDSWRGRTVAIIGDVILDRYTFGEVSRISPEAPVPVVRIGGQEVRAGGAANVASNVVALESRPIVIAPIGADASGRELREVLTALGVDTEGLVPDPERPTPEKTRVLARHQQVVRLDREDDAAVSEGIARGLVDAARRALSQAEALIVSDYGKGCLDERTLGPVLEEARRRGIPAVVDPKIRHFRLFEPATVLTPNLAEAARATAREIRDEADLREAAAAILSALRIDAVLVTRGEEGMLLAERTRPEVSIPALSREVYDVTGAGDTVVAAMGVALAAGWSLEAAARAANAAASIAVGRLGTAAIGLDEVRAIEDGA